MSRRRKRRLVLLGAVIVALGGGLGVFKGVRAMQQARLADEARVEALAAHARGDMGAAIEQFRYAVQHHKDAEVYLAFAEAREKVPTTDGRHIPDAIGLYKKALELLDADPGAPGNRERIDVALHRLVELYGMTGYRYEQIQTADRLLDADPGNTKALAARAEASFVERDFDAASEDTQRLIELEPGIVRWRQLDLEIMRQLGRVDQDMLDRCRQWAAEHQGDGRYQLLEAGVQIEARRPQEARVLLQEAAIRGADSLEVLELLVAALDGLEMRDLAGTVIETAKTKFAGEQWVAEAIVRRAWQRGALSDALDEVQDARARFGTLDRGLLELEALCRAAADRRDEAITVLQMIRVPTGDGTADDRAAAWTAAIEARLYAERGNWTETLEAVDHALAVDPSDPALHLARGEVLAATGELALADAAYEAALRLDPNWITAGLAHARALIELGRPEQAFSVSRHVLERADNAALSPYLVYAESLLAVLEAGGDVNLHDALLGHSRDVIGVFEGIRGEMSDNPAVAAVLVELRVRAGDRAGALQLIDDTLDRGDAPAGLLLGLAEVSRRHGLERGDALADRAAAMGGDAASVALVRASQLASRGQVDAARAVVDDAIATLGDGDASRTLMRARLTLMLRQDAETGREALREFGEARPNAVETHAFILGRPEAWEDRTLIESSIERLSEMLGAESHRVRLARARMLVRFHGDDEAQLAEATLMLADILDEAPDSLAALTFMAEASIRGAHPSPRRAIEHLERAVAVTPSRADLYPRLIALLQEQGDFDAAGRYLERLSSLTGRHAGSRRAELHLLQQQGDFETALVRAAAVLEGSDDRTDQLLLAAMHRRAGRLAEAEAIYVALLGDRTDAMSRAQAAEFFAGTGRFVRGLQTLTELEPDGAERCLLIAMYHLEHGRTEDAGAWIERGLEMAPDSAEVRHVAARYHLVREERAEAREHAMAGLRIDADHVGLRGTLALASLATDGAGRSEAIAALRELGAGQEDLLALLEFIEGIPVRNGELVLDDATLETARRLVDEHGTIAATWSAASRLHAQAGRFEDAVEIARRAVGRFPADPQPAQWASELLLGAGRIGEALAEAEEWRRRSLHDPLPADVAVARILLRQGRAVDAVDRLEPHARRLEQERHLHPQRLGTWLQALLGAGRVDTAVRTVRPLLAESEVWRRDWFGLALGLPDDAATVALRELEKHLGDDPAERLQLARAWHRLARRTGESAHFDIADRLALAADTPDTSLETLILRGSIAEGRGDYAAAIPLYRIAQRDHPDHPVVLNNLAYALLRAGRVDEAVAPAERAASLMGEHPDILDTCASVLRAAGRLDEAETMVRKARRLRPDDPSIILTLAEILLDRGRRPQAEAELSAARRAINASASPSQEEVHRAAELEKALGRRSAQVRE